MAAKGRVETSDRLPVGRLRQEKLETTSGLDGRFLAIGQSTTTTHALAFATLVAMLFLAGCSGSPSDNVADGDRTSAQATGERSIGDEVIERTETDEFGVDGQDDEQFTPDAAEQPEELPEVEQPELAEPDDLLPDLRSEVGDALEDAVASPDVDILDVAQLSDTAASDEEIASFDDGHPRTSSGKLIVLDEAASLACANVEIAVGAIDEGELASAQEHISTAGQRAGRSEVEVVQKWSEALGQAASADPIDATTLVGFLSVCIEGGYVI